MGDNTWGELHAHSYFSFLDGTSSPEVLVTRAAELGYQSLAVTDHDSLAGLIAHAEACAAVGITPIAGTELTLEDGSHLTLLARDAVGYRSLCRAVSQAQLAGIKGRPRATLELLSECAVGLECLTGCRRGRVPAALLADDQQCARAALDDLCQIFGAGHVWIEVQQAGLPDDARLTYLQAKLARTAGVGLVATGNVHYAMPEDRDLQDVLTCIRTHVPLSRALPHIRQGASWHLRSPQEMRRRFAGLPQALQGVQDLLERCRFDLAHIDARLPTPPLPDGMTALGYFTDLVWTGAQRLYGAAVTSDEVQGRLRHEIQVITAMDLVNYFLIVRDIVRYAERKGILCQARGSAVGSCACYCLGISSIDPIAHHLSFERFLAYGRTDPPDIDIDFPSERDGGRPGREQVIQYVLATYAGHAALVATLSTYHHRSAVRDIGTVLGFGRDQIDRLAKEQERWESHDEDIRRPDGLSGPLVERLLSLCRRVEGMPRHFGQHPGGIVLTARPLSEVAPIERARMENRVIIQWDKDAAETARLIKTDHLGLGMLAVIDETFEEIGRVTGKRPSLQGFDCTDPAVYDMLCAADTIGAFQLESRAQITACLPRLQPRTLSDLAAAVALIRPGPIQGNATGPYFRRRQGLEPVTYPGGEAGRRLLEPVLADTYGVILYQDEVIDVALAAGMTQAEAAELRRAMGSKRSSARMRALSERLEACLVAHGLEMEARVEIAAMMSAFSSYGFVRGHAVAFGYLAYVSCWLKKYWGPPFTAAVLNALPMGYYPADFLIQDAQRHGIGILPLDVRASRTRWTVEGPDIRIGLRTVKGLGNAACQRIEAIMQGDMPAETVADVYARAALSEKEATALATSGALAGLDPDRRAAMWYAPTLAVSVRQEWLPTMNESTIQPVTLPPLSPLDATLLDYRILGFSPTHHVMELLRPDIARYRLWTSATIQTVPRGTVIAVAGQVIARQRPGTAGGTVFISLSDEWGVINVVVSTNIYAAYRTVLREEILLCLQGSVERRFGVTSLIVERACPLVKLLTPRASQETAKTIDQVRGKEFR